jgi:uracil-DNA glycosylase family 4
MSLCRPFLDAELRIVRPKVVLLIGTMAIEAFFGKGTLEKIIGTYQEHDGIFLLPLPHPSGVSRWLNDPEHKKLHQKALEILANWRTLYDL